MKILLIRLRLVGDVVFTTPAVRAVRRRFPHAHIAYLIEQSAAPVLRGNPHVDELIIARHRHGLQRLIEDVSLARRLRYARFDIVIDLHGGPRSSWLTWASGAARRIGYTIPGRTWIYSEPIFRPRELRRRHSVENQWDLLSPLGIEPPEPERDPVEMPDDAAARQRADRKLAACGIGRQHELVIMHVSAGNPFRRWPAASFAETAARLASVDPGRRVIFTSGPSDATAATEIAQATRARLGPVLADRIAASEEFDLPELRAVIQRAALYIGGDSGPLHVAATTETPIVALYGPTLPARSAPWRPGRFVSEAVDAGPLPCRPCDQRQCEPGDFRCLTSVTPDAVVRASERALAREREITVALAQPTTAAR
jgi:predicted lipopolysaccharide heptosyltransferase III